MSASERDPAAAARSWLAAEGFDLRALATAAPLATTAAPPTANEFVPDLACYDQILVGFSGGKDSQACLLHLLELGVPRGKIECQHHLVDGREGSTLMDWPCTESYVAAICRALGVKLTFSWREGGIEREMTRRATPTAPVWIPHGQGYRRLGGKGPPGTRLKFPQVSPDLSVRWCSAVNKIDVFARYLCHEARFLDRRTLVVTGERAQESRARANYRVFEPHRCDTRNSKRVARHVDVWRAVHGWSEHRVWKLIEQWKLTCHPAYYLGWGRVSCRCCIFGSANQWASVRAIAPGQFAQIARYEREFGITIHRTRTVAQRADTGTPYALDPRWVAIANSREFTQPAFMDPWVLPQGAYGEGCGPT